MPKTNFLYIRCKACGKIYCIGKTIGAYLNAPKYAMTFIDGLNQFYKEHFYCKGNGIERMYHFELCEMFPYNMTDNPIDETGIKWEEKNRSSVFVFIK